jgi:dipeptidase
MKLTTEMRQGNNGKTRQFKISLWMTAFLAVLMILSVWPGEFVGQKGQRGCTMILVGKQATADGSVLMSYSNDWDGKGASHVVFVPRAEHKAGETIKLTDGAEIPQALTTYAYIGNELMWTDHSTFENGINEHQVAICFGTAVEVNPKAREVDPLIGEKDKNPGILIPWRLVLERAKTAKEGVELVEKLFNQYGLREDGSFAIADPNEIWVFQIGGGHHWAAMRVPDDSYVIYDNTFRMGEINCGDRVHCRCSPNLVQFSKEKGLFDPASGPFSFKKAWGRVFTKTPPADRRIWRVQSLLTSGSSLSPDTPYFDYPLARPPDQKITKEKLMSIMRDHYEGSKLDLTDNYKKANPHHTSERTLCVTRTQYTVITQLRSWFPGEIGGVFWLAMANPDISAFIPWYQGITETPPAFRSGSGRSDQESAYWAFKRIGVLVNAFYGELIGQVRSVWKALEGDAFAQQDSIEKTALELFSKDVALAKGFLTAYSNALAFKAYQTAQTMIKDLETRCVELQNRQIEKSSWVGWNEEQETLVQRQGKKGSESEYNQNY